MNIGENVKVKINLRTRSAESPLRVLAIVRSFPRVSITSSIPGLTVFPVRATRSTWAIHLSFVPPFFGKGPKKVFQTRFRVIGKVGNPLRNGLDMAFEFGGEKFRRSLRIIVHLFPEVEGAGFGHLHEGLGPCSEIRHDVGDKIPVGDVETEFSPRRASPPRSASHWGKT